MLKLIEQDQLIEQDGTQNDELGLLQTFDGDLTSPLEYVLEQTVERLNCTRFQTVLVTSMTLPETPDAVGVTHRSVYVGMESATCVPPTDFGTESSIA